MSIINYTAHILIGIYLLTLFIIAYRNRHNITFRGFSIADNKINFLGTTSSLVSGFRDGAGLAAWMSLAYYFGFGALWLTVGLALGLTLIIISSKKLKNDNVKNKIITISELVNINLGSFTSKLTSLVILATSFLYAIAQLYISGKVFSLTLDISLEIGIIISIIIVGLYVSIGGYRAVIKTDILQWIIILAILLIPLVFFTSETISLTEFNSFIDLSINFKIAFVGISFLVVYTSADVWQRMISCTSYNVFKKSVYSTILIYFLISTLIIMSALIIKSYIPESNPETVLFDIFTIKSINKTLLASMGLFVFASLMSTLDTQLFLFSTTLTNDFLKISDSRKKIRFNRIVIWIMVVIMAFLSMLVNNIVTYLFSAVTMGTTIFGILLLITLLNKEYNHKWDNYFAATIIISVLVYICFFITGIFDSLIYTLIPAIINIVLVSILYICIKENKSIRR